MIDFELPESFVKLRDNEAVVPSLKAKHEREISCLKHWFRCVLPYRCDTAKARVRYHELAANSTRRDSNVTSHLPGTTKILRIRPDETNPLAAKRFIHVADRSHRRKEGDDVALNSDVGERIRLPSLPSSPTSLYRTQRLLRSGAGLSELRWMFQSHVTSSISCRLKSCMQKALDISDFERLKKMILRYLEYCLGCSTIYQYQERSMRSRTLSL